MTQFGTKTLSLLFTSMLLSVSMVEGQLDSVSLGTAGDFAIVSRTGVTNTGVTSVIGDLGISPIGVAAYTRFNLTLDGTGKFSTSPSVTGELYAADHADPTPAKMITAISDMQTAYNDAAGRVDPDYTEHGAGAIQGFTLTQGLYKWGTNVGITSSLYFDGGVADGLSDHVWILQVAGNVIIGNGAIMTLTNGAQAKNIFWQVAGQTTFGTTTQNEGVFLCKTAIVFQTGSSLNGAALAQTAVTLDAATIVN